jgi:hypothetical protein
MFSAFMKTFLLSAFRKKENRKFTVPRVNKLLLMNEPSFRRRPVVSVFELSDPARSIKFCTTSPITLLSSFNLQTVCKANTPNKAFDIKHGEW